MNVSQLTVIALATVGLGLSYWIAWYGRGRLPGCGAGSGCDAAASSRWAYLGAIPVALLGAGLYAGVLATGLVAVRLDGDSGAAGVSKDVMQTLSFTAGGAAVWFTLLQLVVVRRVCAYCMGLHTVGVLLASSVAVAFPGDGPALWGVPASIAVVAVGLLAVGQAVLKPRTYAIVPAGVVADNRTPEPTTRAAEDAERPALGPTTSNEPARRSPLGDSPGMLSARPADESRIVVLLAGRVRLPSDAWRRLGPADAIHSVAFLFDYTCDACRKVHSLLHRAVARRGGDLAVLLVPVPQSARCNPLITNGTPPAQRDACHYARLGHAVWADAPHAFALFDGWLGEGRAPPPLDVARARAVEVLGAPHRDAALLTPRVDRQLREAVALYKSAGAERVPTLLLPRASVTGPVPSLDELMRVLARELDTLTAATARAATAMHQRVP